MKKLTIGIPTYKRPMIVGALIKKLVEQRITDYVDILLIDDGPSNELEKMLLPFENEVKVIFHSENQGYAKTFCEFFSICTTEYILITADDDNIVINGIKEIIKYLEEYTPSFLSPIWLKNGNIHRGKDKLERIILSQVGQASNHAPGLVYNVNKVKPHVSFLQNRLSKACQISFFYPQVVVLYILILKGNECLWHPAAPIEEGSSIATNLKDASGNTYYSLSGRWQIYLSMIDLFDELADYDLSEYSINALNSLKYLYRQNAYERISFTIRKDYKEFMPVWIAGSIVYNLKRPLATISHVFNWLYMRKKHKRLLLKNESELLDSTSN